MMANAPVPGRPLPERTTLANIEFLLLDVDGVLTDGRIHFDRDGNEYKSFHVHDAAGLVYWHRSGGRSGFLSGRGGAIVERRARDLGVHEVILNRTDKAAAFQEMLARQRLDAQRIAYVGDDLLDLAVLRQVGFAATVPEARAEVVAEAQFVTRRAAGFGAARDVIEQLLIAKGRWQDILQRGGQL
jgi:3-deoxy-D-manno-octulosonate 8-phosphate phosphatase (KDO 8-P phosphatase)